MNLLQRAKAVGVRRLVGAFAVAVTAGTLIAGPAAIPASASVPTLSTTFTIVNATGGLCLNGFSSGAVDMHSCNGDNDQKWYLEGTNDKHPWFTLNEFGRNLCLNNLRNGNLDALPCDGKNLNQNWYGIYEQILSVPSAWCLTGGFGGAVHMRQCGTSAYQNWIY